MKVKSIRYICNFVSCVCLEDIDDIGTTWINNYNRRNNDVEHHRSKQRSAGKYICEKTDTSITDQNYRIHFYFYN